MSADGLDMTQTTPAEEAGIMLAFCGFVGLGLLSAWEILGSPSRVLFVVAGFVLLVGLFAAVEGGQ